MSPHRQPPPPPNHHPRRRRRRRRRRWLPGFPFRPSRNPRSPPPPSHTDTNVPFVPPLVAMVRTRPLFSLFCPRPPPPYRSSPPPFPLPPRARFPLNHHLLLRLHLAWLDRSNQWHCRHNKNGEKKRRPRTHFAQSPSRSYFSPLLPASPLPPGERYQTLLTSYSRSGRRDSSSIVPPSLLLSPSLPRRSQ